MAVLALQTSEAEGVRPRDWDPETFRLTLMNNGSEAENCQRNLMAYYRCVDQGDELSALNYLESCLACSAKMSPQVRMCVFLETACAVAVFRHSAANARIWWERARKAGKPPSTSSLEAVMAMAEERYEDALSHFAAARAFVEKRRLDSGLARFAQAKRAEYEEQCRTALSVSR